MSDRSLQAPPRNAQAFSPMRAAVSQRGKSAIKRALMFLYCHELLSAAVVAFFFRAFGLRSA